MHKLISATLIAVGLALMVMKIYADSEPGAIPLALILFGIGWYAVTPGTVFGWPGSISTAHGRSVGLPKSSWLK